MKITLKIILCQYFFTNYLYIFHSICSVFTLFIVIIA
nr:MAG TPA: hypothetical protein [Inoviridae sp.]